MVAASSLLAAGETARWEVVPGARWITQAVAPQGKPGFTLLAPAVTGVQFTNSLDEWNGAANRVLYNGAGLAAGDYDGDGWPDVFLCNLNGTNALFRNLGGWRFEDVTVAAGLNTPLPESRGAVFADINGDAHLDLLVSVNRRGVLCFLNDGRGRFTDATANAGTASPVGSTTLALADVDGNGTLDLYIANYRPDDIRDRGRARITLVAGRPIMAGTETNRFILLNGRLEECGQPDQLLLNDGTGCFRPVSWTGGAFLDEAGRPLTEPPPDWGLTATFRDVNGDHAPDLYVCNDYWTPDRFWLNDGHGRFRAVPRATLRRTSASSMSVDFADIDRDGFLDFFVVDMLSRYPAMRKRQMLAQATPPTPVGVLDDRPQIVQNTLFLNQRDGTFAEISQFAGVPASDWSWAPVFLDVDLDGFEDLLIGAGHFRDVQDLDAEAFIRSRQHGWDGFPNEAARQKAFTLELMEHNRLYPLLQMPIGAFRNLGDCRFTEVTELWGLNQPGIHQGLVLADFDQDGDLDLAVNNLNGPTSLYRNEGSASRVSVRLKGTPPNTQAIGSVVTLRASGLPMQTREVTCGGRYQSGADTSLTFATAGATNLTLEVVWRSGRRSTVNDVRPNRLYEIAEAESREVPASPVANNPPLFADLSDRLAHRHPETGFDDYDRQPLLPFKLSQLGPGVAWLDLNVDGHDDLVIGAGRGGCPAIFLGDGNGAFRPLTNASVIKLPDDSAGLVSRSLADGTIEILASLSGYEAASTGGLQSWRFAGADRPVATDPTFSMAAAGALALGDLSGDGQWALFVAGGVLPGQYPLGAPSRLLRLQQNRWEPDPRNNVLLENLGIVNGAVWSDLDSDGFPELVLACEWGPIRVFRARGGLLTDLTAQLGLSAHTGWWRGVTTGDLNNDGRLDIVASNWGFNSPYRASTQQPLVFAYGQIAVPGVMEVIETEYVGGALQPRRQFMALANALPFLQEVFPSHRAYSEAGLEQVLGERLPLSRRVSATTLASTVFLNTGVGFRVVELPREAQFAPAFSVNVADFDGDGNEDLFLSQNFFGTQAEMSRMDAGNGLWLRGDGTGSFSPMWPASSGIKVLGEQRGAAVSDFDEDGRPDLVITQNGAATKLYHNRGGQPGLRVRLSGNPGNPAGIGAALRLEFAGGSGPIRELHAGSGYWSQDSPVQVLAMPSPARSLWVRWPGGRVTSTPVPPGAKEIRVDTAGKIVSQR